MLEDPDGSWTVGVGEPSLQRLLLSLLFFQSLPSEIEVKYKIAECYTILKLDKDAIAVLDGIPSRQRTPKVGTPWASRDTSALGTLQLRFHDSFSPNKSRSSKVSTQCNYNALCKMISCSSGQIVSSGTPP